MADRRGSRFVLEALFLVALATALALAHLAALEIVGAMALGWVVVAVLEWVAWRSEPHYGSGLPPRYYVPVVELPPPQPLEQVEQGYPDASREEAPTWVASAALRAEVLGEWPVAAPATLEPVDGEEDDDEEEQAFVPATDPGADPWLVAALPAAPLGEPAAGDAADEAGDEEVLDPAPPPAVSEPRPAGPAPRRTARYTFDPLGDPPPRRRFGRGRADGDAESLEVEARPSGRRSLPGGSER